MVTFGLPRSSRVTTLSEALNHIGKVFFVMKGSISQGPGNRVAVVGGDLFLSTPDTKEESMEGSVQSVLEGEKRSPPETMEPSPFVVFRRSSSCLTPR